jgi:hypothetical protein
MPQWPMPSIRTGEVEDNRLIEGCWKEGYLVEEAAVARGIRTWSLSAFAESF